jgi:adenylate cyclase
MFGQLVPCGGGSPIPLLKLRLVVGRSPDCDVPIPSGTVSSKHCYLEQRDGMWFVTDMASRNGIRIDGVRCQEGRLPPGSVLWIAQQRFQVEYAIKVGPAQTASPSGSPRASAPATPAHSPGQSDTDVVDPPLGPLEKVGEPAPRVVRFAAGLRQPSLKPGMALGELIPCGGGAPIPLTKPKLIVGRSPACDITLPFPMVSSKHCQLEFKSGFWHVRDLGSRNGIRVDGIFQLAKYLKPGEILAFAKHRYEIAYTPQADEAPPEENPFALSLLEKAGLAGRGGGNDARLPAAKDDEPVRKKWSIDE